VWAGLLAAAGVALCGRFLAYSAAGAEPAVVIALALAAAEAWRSGRVRLAMACAVGCGLLRVEAWPFLLAGGAWLWRRAPEQRPAIAAAAALIPAAWLGPELAGSGDLLRSGGRARVPNPGQPALAAFPAAASAREAATLLLWPLWLGVVALGAMAAWPAPRRAPSRAAAHPALVPAAFGAADPQAAPSRAAARRALIPAAFGAAWVAVVAGMAQVGFSGEARYALPGVAGIAVSGAVGVVVAARRARSPLLAAALATVLLAVPIASRAARLPHVRAAQAYQWRLASELSAVVRAAGGRAGVLACGRPYVGPYRGPLMAYRLGVVKAAVEPDAAPRPPAVVFRSALTASSSPAPVAPAGARTVVRSPLWHVQRTCAY
jgi:hypothetical protein